MARGIYKISWSINCEALNSIASKVILNKVLGSVEHCLTVYLATRDFIFIQSNLIASLSPVTSLPLNISYSQIGEFVSKTTVDVLRWCQKFKQIIVSLSMVRSFYCKTPTPTRLNLRPCSSTPHSPSIMKNRAFFLRKSIFINNWK